MKYEITKAPKKKKKQIIIHANDKNYSKTRKILLSLLLISLSSTVLVTATKALFTGEEEAGTHIVTGNLDFEFSRTKLAGNVLDDKGFLSPFESTKVVDLSISGANAFDIDLLVPGSKYIGTFNLKNTGSTAFESKISFVNLVGENDYLLEQIIVSTSYNNNLEEYSLKDFNKINIKLGILAKNNEVNFEIGIYLPETANNNAQNSEVNFDLRLEATQVLNN